MYGNRITLADADLAMKRRDFEAALGLRHLWHCCSLPADWSCAAMLRLIPQDSVYHTRAKMKVFIARFVCCLIVLIVWSFSIAFSDG